MEADEESHADRRWMDNCDCHGVRNADMRRDEAAGRSQGPRNRSRVEKEDGWMQWTEKGKEQRTDR